MLSSFAVRLKALSPFQLALLVLAALALLGSSTAVASNLITGKDIQDKTITGKDIADGAVNSHGIQDGHVLREDLSDGVQADLSRRARNGKSGTNGAAGANGADGKAGATGTHGVKGDTGAAGANGADGADGNDGFDGAPGADGADGATGPRGPAGPSMAKSFQMGFPTTLDPGVEAEVGSVNFSTTADQNNLVMNGAIVIGAAALNGQIGIQECWFTLDGVQTGTANRNRWAANNLTQLTVTGYAPVTAGDHTLGLTCRIYSTNAASSVDNGRVTVIATG